MFSMDILLNCGTGIQQSRLLFYLIAQGRPAVNVAYMVFAKFTGLQVQVCVCQVFLCKLLG